MPALAPQRNIGLMGLPGKRDSYELTSLQNKIIVHLILVTVSKALCSAAQRYRATQYSSFIASHPIISSHIHHSIVSPH